MQLRNECVCGCIFHGQVHWLQGAGGREDLKIRYDQFVEKHCNCLLIATRIHPTKKVKVKINADD